MVEHLYLFAILKDGIINTLVIHFYAVSDDSCRRNNKAKKFDHFQAFDNSVSKKGWVNFKNN